MIMISKKYLKETGRVGRESRIFLSLRGNRVLQPYQPFINLISIQNAKHEREFKKSCAS